MNAWSIATIAMPTCMRSRDMIPNRAARPQSPSNAPTSARDNPMVRSRWKYPLIVSGMGALDRSPSLTTSHSCAIPTQTGFYSLHSPSRRTRRLARSNDDPFRIPDQKQRSAALPAIWTPSLSSGASAVPDPVPEPMAPQAGHL
jgi:hypothetical protein